MHILARCKMTRRGTCFALTLLAVAGLIFSLTWASCPFSHGDDEHHDHHHHIDSIVEPGDGIVEPGDGKKTTSVGEEHELHFHQHKHSHDHDHDHDHSHHHHHHHHHGHSCRQEVDHPHSHDHLRDGSHTFRLAEEIAEEEELQRFGFMSHAFGEETHHHHVGLSTLGLWARALGCSLLVSMASLICLILLPLIVAQGKPSQIVVDALATFGAGAMLGDAFLHQLPHALGSSGGHSHSHGVEHGHVHGHHDHSPPGSWSHSHAEAHTPAGGHSHGHGHAHSIQDLSVGLAVLAGIILFFIVEKIVREVEKLSSKGTLPWAHRHHHHHHPHDGSQHREVDDKHTDEIKEESVEGKDKGSTEDGQDVQLIDEPHEPVLRKRAKKVRTDEHEDNEISPLLPEKDIPEEKLAATSSNQASSTNLVLGYLNLFSDGVHNFTDGMALGSAFLLHGTVGGWSRTLFLLAHELPQEVGDFGILVRSGFSVVKALTFNFLSALAALAGTALALLLGGSPGHSSLIEGFTAGGFIYIAVAGVLPEMHQQGTTARTTLLQLFALCLGMSVALVISLVE